MSTTATPKSTAKTTPSWKEVLAKSEVERVKAKKADSNASALLWQGAKTAVTEWVEIQNSGKDTEGEYLYAEVMSALGGEHRKGDASKIRTVARAVVNSGLDLGEHKNLSQAYTEATRITKTVKVHAEENEAASAAAERAAEEFADSEPESLPAPEVAARYLISLGIDRTSFLLIDALGADDRAHRALSRAVSDAVVTRAKERAAEEKALRDAETEAMGLDEDETESTPAPKKAAPKKEKPEPAPKKEKPEPAPVEEDPIDDEEDLIDDIVIDDEDDIVIDDEDDLIDDVEIEDVVEEAPKKTAPKKAAPATPKKAAPATPKKAAPKKAAPAAPRRATPAAPRRATPAKKA